MLVYDLTGSIELRLPLNEKIRPELLIPGHTVLSMENVSCLLSPKEGKLYLKVPERMRYNKVYIYNHSEGEDELHNEV